MQREALRSFLICYGTGMASSSLAASLFYFFVRDVLNVEEMVLLFLLIYMAAGAVGMLLWSKIAVYVGELRAWRLAMAYSAITFSATMFLNSGQDIAFAVLCVISGFASGADFLMPIHIMKEMVQSVPDDQRRRNWIAMAVVGKSAALLGCLPLLFIKKLDQLSPEAHHITLVVAYVILPVLIKLVAIALWSRWIKYNGGQYEKNSMRGDAYVA